MARRRSSEPKPTKLGTFDAAFGAIDKMEQAVCYRAVSRGYTINDVCEYLWEPGIVAALRAAYPLTPNIAHGRFWDDKVLLNGVACVVHVDTGAAHMVTPAKGFIAQVIEHASAVMEDIYILNDTHRKFQRVRNVINWLNDFATPMAARYYFPSLGALLPVEHRFHSMDGLKSAGCKGNIAEIADDMRDSAQIIATGLLCEPDKVHNDASLFKVHIVTDEGQSNEFALI